MGAELSGELPDPLDRIQFGTIGWKELQGQVVPVVPEERLEQDRVMILRIVEEEYHLPGPASVAEEQAQEALERHRIELRVKVGHQFPRADVDRPEQGGRLAGRRQQQNGILVLRRHPHGGAGAMLLEVAFIQTPQIHVVASGQLEAFF